MNPIASQELVTATWIVIGAYVLLTLYFVVRGALKIRSMADYAVGNVQFSPIAVGLSLAASMTSAATFIINPGFISLYGVSAMLSFGILFPIGALVSLVVLSKRFRTHGSSVKALTMAQWIGTRYGSRNFGLWFAVLSFLQVTFIVLICVGLTKLLSKSLNLGEMEVLIAITVFIFGYMMFGGANSMVYTNTVQAILMIVVAFILLGSGYEHFRSGLTGFLDSLKSIDPELTSLTNQKSFMFRDLFEIVIAQLIVGTAVVCQPHIITKALLLKRDSDVNKYLAVGIVVQTLFFLVVFTGFYARLAFPNLVVNGIPLKMDGIIPAYVVSEFPVLVGIVVVMGLLAAGISTLEGLIQALSTTWTTDIIRPLVLNPTIADEEKKKKFEFAANKIVIVLMGVVTVWLTHGQLVNPKLSVGIFAQNGVYAYFAAAFIPISFGMFLKNVRTAAPFAASVTAIAVHFTMYYGKIAIPFSAATGENPGVAAAVAIIAAALVGAAVQRLTRPSMEKRL